MNSPKVIKKVLSNGLTVLMNPISVLPKVSIQLWYNVGSKDEKTGEKGIAHLIEHMIFKGTKKLTECDISLITHKLSGYTNAFTSYDYTGYLFDFPSQHWEESLTILADCMHNATFKDGHLSSELKAVIQELKMYRDNYTSSLIESLVCTIFADHPYHHPIIGYKQDLWNLKRDALVNFYRRHYIPNNATLIIVGDFNPDKAIERIIKEFGKLVPNPSYAKEEFYHSGDLQTKAVKIYRDVKTPSYICTWEVPGARSGQTYLTDIVCWITATGKGSRLYKKLVDEHKLVTELEAFTYDLYDIGLLFIIFQPKDGVFADDIFKIIHQELHDIASKGVSQEEIIRATKQVDVELIGLLENFQKQAYAIGKYYLATGDENYLYTVSEQSKDNLAKQVQDYVKTYMPSFLMHWGGIESLKEDEKDYWIKLQDISDKEDARILEGRIREELVEEGCYVTDVTVLPPKSFVFPRANIMYLENGLKVLYYKTSYMPKIDIIFDFVADHTYDPKGKEGLSALVASLLLEGTKNFPEHLFSDAVESLGMTIDSYPGQIRISLLAEDLEKALEFFHEMVMHATLTHENIEKIKTRMLSNLNEFWDTPMQFATQLAREDIYKGHPYSKNGMGTFEGIKNITRNDVVDFYKKYSPRGTRCGLVGDYEQYDLKNLFNHLLKSWQGDEVLELEFPLLETVSSHEMNHAILRDQTVLCYAALSVSRMSEDYDKLLLFDQIFTGGVLGSMASRLFDLREQTGLFYTIGGSLLSQADKVPGLMVIKTIVSNDRIKEAEVAIEKVINEAINTVTDQEFLEAQQAISNSLITSFSSNYYTAATLLGLDEFGFPPDYFDTRAAQLALISKEEMQQVVKRYLKTDRFVLIRAGRLAK